MRYILKIKTSEFGADFCPVTLVELEFESLDEIRACRL